MDLLLLRGHACGAYVLLQSEYTSEHVKTNKCHFTKRKVPLGKAVQVRVLNNNIYIYIYIYILDRTRRYTSTEVEVDPVVVWSRSLRRIWSACFDRRF